MVIPHFSEQYRCNPCNKSFKLIDVNRTWLCPDCGRSISIKVIHSDGAYSCHRLYPSKIRKEQFVSLDGKNFHEVLDNVVKGQDYRMALKGYKVVHIDSHDFVLVINGGWYDHS